MTRDQRRNVRKRAVRARTVVSSREARRHLTVVPTERDPAAPRTRGDCFRVERPCPYVGCKHHLYLDVSARTGSVKLNFPDLEFDELSQSCALDVAANGPRKLEDVADLMNLTRERARQIENNAMRKLRAAWSP